MTSLEQWNNVIGSTAIDADGEKIGKVGQIYANDSTGEPEWVTVSTGLFGTRESFAPLYNARPGDGELQLAVTKQLIKDAPNIDTDGHLDGSEIDTLYQHYSGHLGGNGQAPADTGTYAAGEDVYEPGVSTSGTGDDVPATDAGTYAADEDVYEPGVSTSGSGDAMTRSEERLHVGTESVQAGRARLRSTS